MNDVFESVDGNDFAFTAFVRASCDLDLVVFADGDGTDLPIEGKLEEIGGSLAGTYIVFFS